jgi:hypothetical protein
MTAYRCRRVEFYSFFILTLDEVSGQLQAMATSPHERTPVPTEKEAEWVSEPVWMIQRGKYHLPQQGLEPQINQLAARSLYKLRYPDSPL